MDLQILRPWMRTGLLVAVAALSIAGSTALTPASEAALRPTSVASIPAYEPNPPRVARPEPIPLPAGAIGKLAIPAIGVDAVARPVGVLPSGAMDVTSDIWEVGVFDQTVAPGQPGNALLEGHLDWYTGPAVFWNLRQLQNGDEIDYTEATGQLHRFAVSSAGSLAYNAAIPDSMYSTSGTATITLITCAGAWVASAHTYSSRLLLTATQLR